MKIRKLKNIILSVFLLLALLIDLAVRYSHPIFVIHDLKHSPESKSGLNNAEKFNCSIFHDLCFEFTKNPDVAWLKLLRLNHTVLIEETKIFFKSFHNTVKSRAPPFLN